MRLAALLVAAAGGLAGLAARALAAPLVALDDQFYHDADELTVAAGDAHACALERVAGTEVGGEVVCWGDAGGAGTGAGAGAGLGGASPLEAPAGLFVQLSAAARHTCGVTLEERAVCWGATAPRALLAGDAAAAAARAGAPPVVQVSTGAAHTCTVDQAGRIDCFANGGSRGRAGGGASGGNVRGQLDAPRDAAFVQVSVGNEQSCALRRDGTLACWGSPRGGLLRPPEGQFLQASVSPAGGSACAVALKGHLECWGALYGPHGGQGRVNGTFLQVTVGPLVTCAVRAAGTLQCFGDERRLWRSAGAPEPTTPFVEVSAASAAGDAALCGVTAERVARVLCFGDVPPISSAPLDLEPAVQELLNFDL